MEALALPNERDRDSYCTLIQQRPWLTGGSGIGFVITATLCLSNIATLPKYGEPFTLISACMIALAVGAVCITATVFIAACLAESTIAKIQNRGRPIQVTKRDGDDLTAETLMSAYYKAIRGGKGRRAIELLEVILKRQKVGIAVDTEINALRALTHD